MAQDGEKHLADPDDFDEIEGDFDEEEEDQIEREVLDIANLSMEEVVAVLDPDDIEDFDYCEFNVKSLNAIALRILHRVPRFIKKAKIESIRDLDVVNPGHEDKIKLGKSKFSWWGTLDAFVRDAFPDFSFKRFGINRLDMFDVIIKHLVIPVLHVGSVKNLHKVDTKKLEDAFNEKLLYRMYVKKVNNEEI